MHARYCYRKLSIRLFVRLSMTFVLCAHIGWIRVTSEVITGIIILGSALHGAQLRRSTVVQRNTLNSGEIEVGPLFSAKTCIIFETGQDRTKINSKLHTPFRLVPKLTTLDDLERPLHALVQYMCFGSTAGKFE